MVCIFIFLFFLVKDIICFRVLMLFLILLGWQYCDLHGKEQYGKSTVHDWKKSDWFSKLGETTSVTQYIFFLPFSDSFMWQMNRVFDFCLLKFCLVGSESFCMSHDSWPSPQFIASLTWEKFGVLRQRFLNTSPICVNVCFHLRALRCSASWLPACAT